MQQYESLKIEWNITNRLLSGSDNHCSKSFSTKLRLALRDKVENSGSCNNSTSNDAASVTTSMLI